MGVKSLWEILQDTCCMKEITDLKNESIAIDLATWICEAENTGMMKNSVEKPYLRNLFFRVLNLTLHGVKLIFVIDGKPPQLKWNTIARRLDSRSDIPHSSQRFTGSRSRLNAKFAECCALLDQLGIVWLKSEGEAEATCAALNEHGYVTACATTDGDAFLYGATKVYRNLACRKGAKLECYEMKIIEEKLHLNRNSLISLGLMLGCDYFPSGIPGVGKMNALKLLESWREKGNPLDLMRKWKDREKVLSGKKKPKHCSYCKHSGTKQDHAKYNCTVCSLQCKDGRAVTLECTCEWHLSENNRKATAAEDRIATKAEQVPNFPNEEIIFEFLHQRNVVSPKSPNPPSLDGVADFLHTKLRWRDGISKTFPLVTHWVLNHPAQDLGLSIVRINRTRTKDKVQVYEMEWSVPSHVPFVTCEEQTLVDRRFPDAVKTFQERVEKEKQDKEALKKFKGQELKIAKNETKMTDYFKKVKKVRNNSLRHPISHDDVTAGSGVTDDFPGGSLPKRVKNDTQL